MKPALSQSRLWLCLLVLFLCARAPAAPTANPALFAHASMKPVTLHGLKVWMGKPVQVTAQVGWKVEWAHKDWEPSWAFIHLTPYLAKFPGGNLIATYAMDPDNQDNPMFVSGFQISKDGGAHWGRRYSLLMQHIPMIFIPKEDDSLLAIASETMQRTPGDEHNFVGPAYIFEHGGDRWTTIPDAVKIVDWPWPIAAKPNAQPAENWHIHLSITGSVLKFGRKLLVTAYGHEKGPAFNDQYDDLKKKAIYDNTMLLSSEDGGYTWRYYSTIATPDLSHASELGFEGANETSVIQLADGDLMAVYRPGNGLKWNLMRTYSHDEGRTWTKPETIPAYSVMPEMVRTANETIVLTTGRPGVDMWLSTDPRARTWQKIDLVAHHNSWSSDPSYRIIDFPFSKPYTSDKIMSQTTAYTAIVQVAPNKLLVMYDRDPEQAPAGPADLSRVFVLPVEIERP